MKALRTRLGSGEKITDQASLAALLHLATEDVLHPGHALTLLQVMTAKSKSPQPVVKVLDEEPKREIA